MNIPGLILALSMTAPIPVSPVRSDPFGQGYMGVYPIGSSLMIERVEPNSPADRAKLQAGDLFFQIGERTPRDFDEMRNYVMSFRPGTTITVVIGRQDRKMTKKIMLAARNDNLRIAEEILP